METPKIALIGAGNMAEALIAGILKSQLTASGRMVATDVLPQRLKELEQTYGILVSSNNLESAQWADVIILCIKPQAMNEVLSEISHGLSPQQLVISVAAGFPLGKIRAQIPSSIGTVRAMPNTPSVIQAGVTALAVSKGLSGKLLTIAHQIFESVGKVVVIDESLMDAVTGLSGSGPAYIYMVIESLTDAGVNVGLPRPISQTLAVQTVLGAAKMVEQTGEHPVILKDRVTSPGGTTIAGIQQLEEGGLRATMFDAVEAATNRSIELGQ